MIQLESFYHITACVGVPMALLNNPFNESDNPEIKILVDLFNDTAEDNDVQRIFYLLKINYLLKNTPANDTLVNWKDTSGQIPQSWQATLSNYGINPNASLFMQEIQFANVVGFTVNKPASLKEEDPRALIEAREQLLKQNLSFEACKKQFIELSYRISQVFAVLDNPLATYAYGLFDSCNYTKLKQLIEEFNSLPQENHVQRIFYLQRINHELNRVPLNSNLYNWRNNNPDFPGTWESLLTTYGIDPDASFFLKGAQFAKAIKKRVQDSALLKTDNLYQLMQERDQLLEKPTVEEHDVAQYLALSCRINHLVENKAIHREVKTRHEHYLAEAKAKLNAIKGHTKETSAKYKTGALGTRHVNNFNYKLIIDFLEEQLPKLFTLRIEDREHLSIEQKLHSYPVSAYFGDDIALAMVRYKDEDEAIVHKPMVISQFANEGDMRDVAKKLSNKSTGEIASQAKYFFQRICDFSTKLTQADVYHPDIKLSNFLVHNKRLLVCDRKTFVTGQTQKATNIRSTISYAPLEYAECINKTQNGYTFKAMRTSFDMKQFMAYQVGMALKEFLLLTQMNELPDDYWSPECDIESYFKKPNYLIKNYTLLVREMTRAEEGKRLSIEHLQKLLPEITKKPYYFSEAVEALLPSSELGIEEELNQINTLLACKKITDEELEQANAIFRALTDRPIYEHRLHWHAEKLAIKCHEDYSKTYFSKISQTLETVLLDHDWLNASWYRKAAYIFTFGYLRVPQVTPVETIKLDVEFQSLEFQFHFAQFAFLPTTQLTYLGATEAEHLALFLSAHINEIAPKDGEEHNLENESSLAGPASLNEALAQITEEEDESLSDSDSISHSIVIHMTTDTARIAQENNLEHEEEEPEESATVRINRTNTNPVQAQESAQTSRRAHTRINSEEAQRFFAQANQGIPLAYEQRSKKHKIRYPSLRRADSLVLRGELSKLPESEPLDSDSAASQPLLASSVSTRSIK